jgi:hypothetical protein
MANTVEVVEAHRALRPILVAGLQRGIGDIVPEINSWSHTMRSQRIRAGVIERTFVSSTDWEEARKRVEEQLAALLVPMDDIETEEEAEEEAEQEQQPETDVVIAEPAVLTEEPIGDLGAIESADSKPQPKKRVVRKNGS